MTSVLPATHFQVLGDFTAVRALELFLPTCLLMLGNQSMYQKFFSAKSEKDAARAVVGWFVGIVILETVIVAIAVVGSALFRSGEVSENPREILAYTALHALPHLLGAIMVGAIFAKVISTANNYLFSPATNLINDVYVRYVRPEASNRNILLVSRVLVVLLGCWSLYQSLGTHSVLEKALVCVHDLFGCADTGDSGGIFLEESHGGRGGYEYLLRGPLLLSSGIRHSSAPICLRLSLRATLFFRRCWLRFCVLILVSLVTAAPTEEQLRPFSEG